MVTLALQWIGKEQAFLEADTPPQGELIACPEQSIDFEATNNRLLIGDNLEILKHMQSTHLGRVDMIYIDPPYNTGKDFVYRDRGRTHAEWLNMMVPRLVLARRLLHDDGVIFVSINEVELHHLRCVMDEIFGEDNYIETFVWTKTNTAPSLSLKSRKTIEYIVCYEKVRNRRRYRGEPIANGDAPLLNRSNPISILQFPKGSIRFHIPDGVYKKGAYERVELLEDVEVRVGVNSHPCIVRGAFKWTQDRLNEEIKRGTYFLIKSKRFSIRFQRVDMNKYKAPTNWIDRKHIDPEIGRHVGVGTNEAASLELQALDLGGVFDYPKPVSLIQYLIRFSTHREACILDFFAGSGTTAAAVLAQNKTDGGNRHFICIQIPEATDPQSTAYRAGYSTISDITVARIHRVIRGTEQVKGLGGGCRVYRHALTP